MYLNRPSLTAISMDILPETTESNNNYNPVVYPEIAQNPTVIQIAPIKGDYTPIKNEILTTNNDTMLNLTTAPVYNNTGFTTIKTIVYNNIGVVPMVNVAVNYVPKFQTNTNGEIEIKGLLPLDQVTFSFLGYKTISFPATAVPAKVMLEKSTTELNNVNVVPKKKGYPWWKLFLGAAFVYGGYRYFYDKKTKKVIKTKI